MKSKWCIVLFCLLSLLLLPWPVSSDETEDCFKTSLHHTTHGMARWYDAKDGFSAVTGVPYKDLGCKNCHVSSCNCCHLDKKDGAYFYSIDQARKSETCLKCHSREQATLGMDKERNTLGVHIKAGMQCADCHSARELHGDGTKYESMRQPGAMDTECSNCHDPKQSQAHTVHKDKLHCTACHVQNSMTCFNCHFGVLKETQSKPKSMAGKAKDFLLLVKYQGKVTSGTMQTLVAPDNYPFVTYVPYFTHSISQKGKDCEECHATEAVKILAEGREFVPGIVKDGKLEFYKGVIPVVPDQLKWPYLEKKDGKWTEFKPTSKPLIQLGVYAEPLTLEEVKKMAIKQTATK